MRKYFGVMLLLLLIVFMPMVNAQAYYVNDNKLEFTEFQYKIMVEIMGEKNVSEMDEYTYAYYHVADMNPNNSKLSIVETNPTGDIMPNAYFETPYKRITMSSTCYSDYCIITTTCYWKQQPKVRSYDVIGVRLMNTIFTTSTTSTYYRTNKNSYTSNYYKGFDNGVGSVVKLPTDEDIQYIAQTVYVQPKGTVYGTYQHAVKNITLNQALNFTISGGGKGSVFVYPDSYVTYFDNMTGTFLDL